MSRRNDPANSTSERPPDGQPVSTRTERRQLLWDIWSLINRANVTLQRLVGALLVSLVNLEFMLRVRLGWWLGAPDQPPTQPWPLWLMLAISAGMTLL